MNVVFDARPQRAKPYQYGGIWVNFVVKAHAYGGNVGHDMSCFIAKEVVCVI
jgi:hypothetical protein